MPEQQRPDTSGFEAGPDQNSSPAAALAAAAKAKRPPAKPLSEVAEVVPAGGGSTSGLHTTTVLSQDRIERYRRSRFNALLGITPTRLVQYLSDWEAGYLRNMALTMEQILRRDAIYKTVAPKRYADAARQTWQVQVLPGHEKDPEALAQKAALEHFYHNLRCKSAVDGNQTGGVALAIRQMIKFGVGLKYCVHEILWRQTPDGVTATLNHVPPWFFEARTGKLRFLMEDFAWDGVPMAVHDPTVSGGAMEVGSWMVSVGEGLMESGSILYIYGNYALRDWGDYSEQRGYPLMKAHTAAPEGSDRWNALITALASFSPRNPLVMGPKETEDLDILRTEAQGQFAPALLWEEMKKCKTALWRGGDLGTVSAGAGSGQGASLQGGETTNLQEDDCQWVSECFQTQVDPLVVRVVRGPNVPVLAYFSLGGSKKSNTALELQVDTFLLGAGFPLSVGSVAERFNRPVPQPEEPLLKKPEPPSPFGGGGRFGGKGAPPFGGGEGGKDEEGNPQGAEEAEADATPDTDKEQGPAASDEEEDALGRLRRPPFANELANARPEIRPLVAQALARVGAAQSAALKPVADRLRKLLAAPDGELTAGLLRLRRDLPSMLRELNKQPKAAAAFESAIGTALAAGAAGAEKANEKFDEAKHPRDAKGKFADAGGRFHLADAKPPKVFGMCKATYKGNESAHPLVRRLDAPDPGSAARSLAGTYSDGQATIQELPNGRLLVAAPGSLWLVSRTALTHGGERANAEAFDALRKQAEAEAPAPGDEAEADPDAREAMAEALGTAPDDPLVDAALGAGLDPADPELAQKAQQALAAAQGEADGEEGDKDAPEAPEAASGQGSADGTPPGTPGAPEQPTAADAAPDKPFPKPPAGPPPELMDFQQFQRSGWAKPSALGLVVSNAGQLGAQHKAHYAQAVEARKPMLKRVADYYGVQVPYGYQEQGDRYVWKGGGLPKRPVGTEAAANEKDPGFSGQSDKLGAAQSGRVGSVTEPFEHAYAPNPAPSPLALAKQPTPAPLAKTKGPKPPELMDPDEFAASEHATAKTLGVGANQPWHLRAAHRSYVEDAMGKLKPLSRAAVESFNAVGFKLAGGYKDAGDGTLAWSQGEEEVPPKTWAQ